MIVFCVGEELVHWRAIVSRPSPVSCQRVVSIRGTCRNIVIVSVWPKERRNTGGGVLFRASLPLDFQLVI